MPKVTIYIRDEDYTLWENIRKRPEWIHKQIQRATLVKSEAVSEFKGMKTFDTTIHMNTAKDKFCKHNAAIGFCKFGCKK